MAMIVSLSRNLQCIKGTMNKSNVAEAALIAFGMVSWPILGKYSHAAGAWVGVLVMSVTAIVVGLLSVSQGQFSGGSPLSFRMLLILALAGLFNGAAMYRYTMRSTSPIQTGKYLVLVAVLVVLEAPVLDLILNKSWLTPRQWWGVACGIACVYLLNQE